MPSLISLGTGSGGQLWMVLLRVAVGEHATVVADMTRTRFCDPAGLTVLAGAHLDDPKAVADLLRELREVVASGAAQGPGGQRGHVGSFLETHPGQASS